MAVCGRCLICGHKFSGDGSDEAVRWACKSELEPCEHYRKHHQETWSEVYEHAICKWCHDSLTLDCFVEEVEKFLAFVRARSEKLKAEDHAGD